MKNKNILLYLFLGLSVISGLHASKTDTVVAETEEFFDAVEAPITRNETEETDKFLSAIGPVVENEAEETTEEFFDPVLGPIMGDETEENIAIHDFIESAILSTLRAHCDEIDCEDFANLEAEIITEMWIAHLLEAGLSIQKKLFKDGAHAITSYLGLDLSSLLKRVSSSAQEQQEVLSDLIMESFDSAEVKLSQEQRVNLANLMATEIIAETLFRYAKTLKGPSLVDVAVYEGYTGMRNFILEVNRLNEQLKLLSQVQHRNIKSIKVKIKETSKDYPLTLIKLNQELKTIQEYVDYIDGVRTLLSLKVKFLNGIEWATTSRWTWPLRFGAKNTAKLGYKAYKLLPG